MERLDKVRLTRRDMMKLGGAGAGVFALTASGFAVPRGFAGSTGGGSLYIEAFPTSPLILNPFSDSAKNQLPIPKALRPADDSSLKAWNEPNNVTDPKSGAKIAPHDTSVQDCGVGGASMDPGGAFAGKYHYKLGTQSVTPESLGLPKAIVYKIELQVAKHSFTDSQVLPINSFGKPVTPPKGKAGPQSLPDSVIFGFNGTFPGPRINAQYGQPSLVHFCNHLGDDTTTDTQDFGAPNRAFLTHLHNGHTAPESDGQPHYSAWRFKYDRLRLEQENGTPTHYRAAWEPNEWVNQLYLGYPAGGDDREKQSFFWFHDHVHGHTGANVYKGMVGLMPIYDPVLDPGDEREGLRLPGVRTDYGPGGAVLPRGTHSAIFDVEYDIPMALYDCRLDDGVTPHKDAHNGNGETHPEWWGKTFFRHFPNHGFVGDVFTVNGTAFPTLHVKRRRYRLRFLDASISRIYELKLMSSSSNKPVSAKDLAYTGDELQGQYRLPDGQQCMKWAQIANEGGLLPNAIVRDSFELWPAKRKEFVVDFTRYQDGSSTKKGDVIWLVNVMKMTTGRMWDSADPKYKIPLVKIVIGDDAPDESLDVLNRTPRGKSEDYGFAYTLREPQKLVPGWQTAMAKAPTFELQRGSATGDPETEWLINGQQFEADKPLISVARNSGAVWRVKNGGGGWVHPMHLHMEEHTVLYRNGKPTPAITGQATGRHIDDTAKEDVIALDPSEETYISRRFRTFTGPYVAHCHNLAHEDHNMMFGWEILPS
jgi:FtsP/CotA-like multicopper oxidase with cupredoxin domain